MIYIKLFIAFFQIGLISFGGGYAAMSPIYDQVVSVNAWLSMEQFTDLITISQMTPGPITLNAATFVGLQIAGFPGAVVATLGSIMPSVIIVSILAYVYLGFSTLKILQNVLKRLKPVVTALIAIAAVSLLQSAFLTPNFNVLNIFVFVGSFLILRFTKLDPTLIIFLSGVVGLMTVIL